MGISKPRPLAGDDIRSGFDCGNEALNRWFQNHAWRNQQANTTRTNIVVDKTTGEIAGYVSIAATEIRRSLLTKKFQRNMPDPVPAVLLGQLAVDQHFQGQGLASHLLIFAFRTAINIAEQIGCYGLVTHPIDETARQFYQRRGFADNPFDPEGSMIVRMRDLRESWQQ